MLTEPGHCHGARGSELPQVRIGEIRLSDAYTGAPVANQTDGTRRAYLEIVG
jgi:hypothetical protein